MCENCSAGPAPAKRPPLWPLARRQSVSRAASSSSNTPAVVRTGNTVKLADHLNLASIPLATTDAGRNFVLKSLHPSESTVKSIRLPGGVRPSVSLTCDMVETFPINDSVVCVYSIPDPSVPVTVTAGGSEGDMGDGVFAFGNAAFGSPFTNNPTPVFYDAASTRFLSTCEQYRVLAQSVTVELIAPALANQGTITAAQVTEKPQKFYAGTTADWSAGVPGPTHVYPPGQLYDVPPMSSKLLLGPAAYTGMARDGVYCPLKLSKLSYKNTNRPVFPFGYDANVPQSAYTFNPATDQRFPYPMMKQSAGRVVFPQWSCPEYTKVVVSGCAVGAYIRIRVRQCIEMIPYPGTVFSALVESPLPPDALAFAMHREICGKMRDGYPASYNDLGKLRDVIEEWAHKLLPFVDPALDIATTAMALIPGFGPFAPMINMGAKAVTKGAGVYLQHRKNVRDSVNGKGSKPSTSLDIQRTKK